MGEYRYRLDSSQRQSGVNAARRYSIVLLIPARPAGGTS
jgi:hypothetical protein